jgi:hypothetical protein
MNDIKPIRIQRKRTKGFKLQDASPNGLPVIYVGRPTKWGNPYKLSDGITLSDSIKLYEIWITANITILPSKYNISELTGHNLSCFCPIVDKNNKYMPCHADILLKLANK